MKPIIRTRYIIVLAFTLVWGGFAPVHAAPLSGLPDFTTLVEQNSPAVVNISTRQKVKAHGNIMHRFNMPDLPENSPFNELFKHFFGDEIDGMPDQDAQSLGSGFVISSDGYILTNFHVVDGADEVVVRFSDRTFYDAKVIGSDKASDVAVIKVDATNLPTATIGKSSDLKVGAWVLAIGSPFGFDHTVTAGIVSAKGRSLPSENYVPFIQTDVAINPGNSGGPLINLDGEVIGINSQIYSRTGGFMGLSFAIPIELAMNVADQLKSNGHVARGYLGVLIQDVDRNLAESFGLSQPHGALVAKVLDDSPASAAGLQTGDVILEYNGHRLINSSQLPPLVGTSRIDGQAKLRIMRDGKERMVEVHIGELQDKEEPVQIAAQPSEPQIDDLGKLGLRVQDVDAPMRKSLGLTGEGGALIAEVGEGPALNAGLHRGDVIQMFDNKAVENAEHLARLVAAAEHKRSVAVLILRKEGPLFVALRLKD